MDLLYPSLGIFFWTFLSFILVVFLLTKFAWKPIVKSLQAREGYIAETLDKSKAMEEMIIKAEEDKKRLAQEAIAEKKQLLKEASEMRDQVITEAKTKAIQEAERIVQEGLQRVEQERNTALKEAKNEIVDTVMELTEKFLQKQLTDKKAQKKFIDLSMKRMHA